MAVLNASNTKIRVTPEILISRADEAQQKISDMENSLNEIQRIVSATRSYWIGEAGDVCRQKYESQQEEINALMKRLKDQPRTLLSIAGIYRDTEEKVKEASSPLPSNVIE